MTGENRMTQLLRLPRLLGEECVLQRGAAVRIWGWCRPLEEISIFLEGQERIAKADAGGRFSALVAVPVPGGPYVLKVQTASGERKENRAVYVGEVFVCAGQSNMELPMRRVRERYPEEFYQGGAPFVHVYKAAERYEFRALLQDHETAAWTVCVPENLEEISALSYFIGKQLQERLQMPVGILNLSLGGTPVEAWTSRQGLAGLPEYLALADRFADAAFRGELTARKEAEEAAWQRCLIRKEARAARGGFQSRTAADNGRAQTAADSWKPFALPGYLEDAGLKNFCGSIRLRRSFEVPAACVGKRGYLQLGTMTDSDTTYINGYPAGETGYCYPPRRYLIPEGLLKEGRNEISIRLVCRNGRGRVTPGKPYRILWEDPCGPKTSKEALPPVELAGQWEYQISAAMRPAPEQEFINRKPTGLFQGMVAPCLPLCVKGVVWYQGESNDCRPDNYKDLLCRFIADWRAQWRQERLPFILVQLPNCGIDIAPEDAWPKIREAQRRAGLLQDTAVTVNLDLGEDNDLHPLSKKAVAARIVRAVCGMIYREKVPYKGPEMKQSCVRENEVCLTFETGDGGPLVWGQKETACTELFEMAGADGIFHPVRAVIDGCRIRLHPAGGRSEQNCPNGRTHLRRKRRRI